MELLIQAWEKYLDDANESALLSAIESNKSKIPDTFDYPYVHRICDIKLNGKPFRVVRVVDIKKKVIMLSINPTNTPRFQESGVPYELKGEKLFKWIEAEEENPSKEDTDWNVYLNG